MMTRYDTFNAKGKGEADENESGLHIIPIGIVLYLSSVQLQLVVEYFTLN